MIAEQIAQAWAAWRRRRDLVELELTALAYCPPGNYKVEIVKAYVMTTHRGDVAIVTAVILASDNMKRDPGTKVMWAASPHDLKQFVQAASTTIGVGPATFLNEVYTEWMFGPTNPLAGLQLGLQCTRAGKYEWSALNIPAARP